MSTAKNKIHKFNVGKWLPADYEIIRNHIKGIKSYVVANPVPLTPNITALNTYVTTNPTINIWSNDMFTEVPAKYQDLDYGNELQSWSEFIPLLNGIMTMTQTFNESGCVGFPINSLLDWAMGTEAGHNFFLDNGVNEHFNKVLNDWGSYLISSASNSTVLNSNEEITEYAGHFSDKQYYWLSDEAMVGMANALNNGTTYTIATATKARAAFIEAFDCPNTSDPHYGFTSWDNFFTRQFNNGVRPIAVGDDVIANACESAPYRVAYDVKREEDFWIKGQPYSLINIFNETEGATPLTDKYTGGTIYQAFLSAECYHRWHSPVSGTIKTVYDTVSQTPFNSTYYSEMLPAGPLKEDDAGPNESQGYISNVATRGIIEITADNKAIGDMCVIPIGMAECATCDITVSVSDTVAKGDEIGMFHFGGSTHLLVFQKDVPLLFDYHDQLPSLNATNVPINSQIATVVTDTIAYETESGISGLCIGSTSTNSKNSGALLAVVPSSASAFPINVGNCEGEFLWGIDASGNTNTNQGTPQVKNPGASCNLHVNFPDAGTSGYVIGDDPNNNICAALKIVVPSDTCSNWPLVVSDDTGKTIWAIDCLGNKSVLNSIPSTETAKLNIPYPSSVRGSNGLTIGDVSRTTGCHGGMSIILPEGSNSSSTYAIAIVDANGDLFWGVNGAGQEVTG